jgi:purine-binding chemotaxis protein CheW
LVDEIDDVLELDENECEPAPDTVPTAIRDLVAGIYRLSDRLLIILNPEKVMNIGAGVATLA